MSFVARPTIRLRGRLLRSLLNHNQLSAIVVADSGETFNFTTTDINLDNIAGADRPVGVPRNYGRLPAYLGVDARYSRFVGLTEKRSLEFYLEATNVFNRRQVSRYQGTNLDATYVDSNTGLLRKPLPDPADMSPTWRESRQVQLGAKLHF